MSRRLRFSPLVCATLATLLASAPVSATPARVLGLGDLTRYVDDDTSVQLYPAQLARHSNFVFFDLGGPSGVSPSLGETQLGGLNGGAYLKLRDGFHLGVLTSDFAPGEHAAFLRQVARNANSGNEAAFDAFVPQTALRRYDVLAAYEVASFLTAGLRLSYGSTSQSFNEVNAAGDERAADVMGQSHFRASLGASGEVMNTGYDVSLDYANYGASYLKNGEAPFVGGGGNAFGLNARARVNLSKQWDLVPQVGYRASAFALREDSIVPLFGPDDTRKVERFPEPEEHSNINPERVHRRTNHHVDAGAAAVLRPSEKTTFWLALGTQWAFARGLTDVFHDEGLDELRDEVTQIHSLPYVKFGFEATLLEWLRVRGGAEKFTWAGSTSRSRDDRRDDGVLTSRDDSGNLDIPDFEAYVGASVLWKGFVLDLLVDREFLRRGPAIVSGAAGNIAMRASLGYQF